MRSNSLQTAETLVDFATYQATNEEHEENDQSYFPRRYAKRVRAL